MFVRPGQARSRDFTGSARTFNDSFVLLSFRPMMACESWDSNGPGSKCRAVESAARFATRPTRDKLPTTIPLTCSNSSPFSSAIRTTFKQNQMPDFSNRAKANPLFVTVQPRSCSIRVLPNSCALVEVQPNAQCRQGRFSRSNARRCKARCRYRKCCCGVVFHTVMRAAPSGGPWTVPRIACHSLCEPWPRSPVTI